eukprot:TRINITY_DN5387_c0_g1_i1.p1 TRINITY_DN5387_c0_g1~~TRINITY_DN5387_c0_g1_i1.p1  ORF type:complete len:616 (+),score=158.09 TRINITY_DN5387_c0_g1_i1:62-1849(+)
MSTNPSGYGAALGTPAADRLSGGLSSYRAQLYARSPTFDDEYGMSVPLDEDELADLLEARSGSAGAASAAGDRNSVATRNKDSATELEVPSAPMSGVARDPEAGKGDSKPGQDKTPLIAKDQPPEPSLGDTARVSTYTAVWRYKRVRELWTTPDWWAVWIGTFDFLCVVACALSKKYGKTKEDGEDAIDHGAIVPHPLKWDSNPLDAWDTWNGVGALVIFAAMALPLAVALRTMKKLTRDFCTGFCITWVLSVLCFWLGSQSSLSKYGFGPAMIGLILGLLIVNVMGMFVDLSALSTIATQGEWFIKIALVLMAVELKLLGEYGAPGIIVGWVCSPITIGMTYWFGVNVLKMENKAMCMLMGCGVSWCGASAITAVAPCIRADAGDVTVAIGIVCFFVIFQTFALAYFARAVDMDKMVAGAWLGGSVDQTANVVIAGDIVSADTKQVASTVKMILNAGLGAMCVGVAMFWVTKVERTGATPTLSMLWDKFPKFVVGFLVLSCVLTIIVGTVNDAVHHALPHSVLSMSNWWMALGFICIGLNTDIRKLSTKVKGGSVLLLYLLGGLFDILFTYGAAHLFFSGVWPAFPRPKGTDSE